MNSAALKPISQAICRELIQSFLLIFLLSIFMLLLLYLAPGSDLLDEYIASLQEKSMVSNNIHIKYSFIETYALWLKSILSGNFGNSTSNGMPVLAQIVEYTHNTLVIIISALAISLLIALPTAVAMARKQFLFLNKSMYAIFSLVSTLPLFWLSYICIYFSGSWFHYFPLAADYEEISPTQLILPVLLLSLGSGVLTEMIQLIQQELKRVLHEEYILYARAKGSAVMTHALKEGIVFPLLHLIGNRVAYLFSACIIVEQIFNWPGIGRILWQAAQDRDVALLLAAVLVSAIIIRLFFFATRIIYILLNPRASHE